MKSETNLMRIAGLILIILPLVVWRAAIFAVKARKVDLRPFLPWIRLVRWAAYVLGVSIWIAAAVLDRYKWWLSIGLGVVCFQIGLSFTEDFVKHNCVPESPRL